MSAAPQHSTHQIRNAPVMTAWGHELCEEVKQLRRQLGISQAQLARLCNVSLRSVKRWEAYQGKPLARTRRLLEHFRRYVEAKGLYSFRQGYLCEEPRYHNQAQPNAWPKTHSIRGWRPTIRQRSSCGDELR
jgi:DNA-binding transcriptional regulator YiaG